MSRDERGAGSVLTAGIACALLAVVSVVVMAVGWFLVARQAERIAEVAALAGAGAAADGADPCAAAEAAAEHNGTALSHCVIRGAGPDVVVEVGVAVELIHRLPSMPQQLVRFATAGTV